MVAVQLEFVGPDVVSRSTCMVIGPGLSRQRHLVNSGLEALRAAMQEVSTALPVCALIVACHEVGPNQIGVNRTPHFTAQRYSCDISLFRSMLKP